MTPRSVEEWAKALHRVFNDQEDANAREYYRERARELWEDLAPADQKCWFTLGAYAAEQVAQARAEEREACAKEAAMFSMKPDRSFHPDIPWEQMNETAQMVAHSTAQQIANALRART